MVTGLLWLHRWGGRLAQKPPGQGRIQSKTRVICDPPSPRPELRGADILYSDHSSTGEARGKPVRTLSSVLILVPGLAEPSGKHLLTAENDLGLPIPGCYSQPHCTRRALPVRNGADPREGRKSPARPVSLFGLLSVLGGTKPQPQSF